MKLVKKNPAFLIVIVTALLFMGCDTENTPQEQQEDPAVGRSEIADIIRNPVTANQDSIDTSTLARLSFEEEIFEFGEVDAGAVIKHTFTFSNEGAVPLIITDVRSTCGCTVASWPTQPIPPGGAEKIPVTFDTKNKNGYQSKPITITANTYPNKTTIYMNGRVSGVEKKK
ncbi:MAG: DUF1573 domain-containing protein [Bacteroidota bacterium]